MIYERIGTKLYEEEGPKDKKPAVKNRLFEKPALNNLSHIYELYEESARDDKNIEQKQCGRVKLH